MRKVLIGIVIALSVILVILVTCSAVYLINNNDETTVAVNEYGNDDVQINQIDDQNDIQPIVEDKKTSTGEMSDIPSQIKDYEGKWYGYGTDSPESLAQGNLEFIDENTLIFNGEEYELVGEYYADSVKFFEDPYGEKNYKCRLEFGKHENGQQALNWYSMVAAEQRQISQSMYFYRKSYMEEYSSFKMLGDTYVKLTEEQAREVLHKWIGNLGTWDAGEENVLLCDGEYYCEGKSYYQFRMSGLVNGPDGTPSHYSTLTWYVVSVDGKDIFEGQCINGSLQRW